MTERLFFNIDFDRVHDLLEFAPQRRYLLQDPGHRILDIVGTFGRFPGQTANIVRHHCEAAAGVAGTGGSTDPLTASMLV